jgi:hypothetical protein
MKFGLGRGDRLYESANVLSVFQADGEELAACLQMALQPPGKERGKATIGHLKICSTIAPSSIYVTCQTCLINDEGFQSSFKNVLEKVTGIG